MDITNQPALWCVRGAVGFDVESTGVDVDNDRIVTANITFHTPTGEPVVRNFLLNPGIEIPEGAIAVHGISNEKALAEGQDAREGIAEILELLTKSNAKYPIVAYNAVFDLTMLDREARRHGLTPFVPTHVIDPFVIDKQVDKWRRGSRTLTATAAHYGVSLENAHSADADSLAAIEVARAIADRYPAVQISLQDLHEAQIQWRAEQQESFAKYLLEKKGEVGDFPTEWPVIPDKGLAKAAA